MRKGITLKTALVADCGSFDFSFFGMIPASGPFDLWNNIRKRPLLHIQMIPASGDLMPIKSNLHKRTFSFFGTILASGAFCGFKNAKKMSLVIIFSR